MTSFVMVFDANEGCFTQEARYTLPPRAALIAAVNQYKGNITNEYPKDMPGIYNSNVIEGRLLYDINEHITLYSQEA